MGTWARDLIAWNQNKRPEKEVPDYETYSGLADVSPDQMDQIKRLLKALFSPAGEGEYSAALGLLRENRSKNSVADGLEALKSPSSGTDGADYIIEQSQKKKKY